MSSLPPNPENHPFYGDWLNNGLGGWYTPGSCEFAGFLHNPYSFNYLSEIQKKDVEKHTVCKIKAKKNIIDIIDLYFSNRKENELKGLVHQYSRLYKTVLARNIIGLFLWGADGSNDVCDTLYEYTMKSGDTLQLSIHSICVHLIKEFIKPDNIDSLIIKKNTD